MNQPESTAAERSPVTVLGLGAMGRALAGAFLDAGHPTTVWNRSPGKADGLVSQGASAAATSAEAVAASPLVVVCVTNYEAVDQVFAEAGEAVAGRVVVNLTNGTPEQARETAAGVEARGARYLDGGIMAVPSLIADPAALVLYSGSPEAFAAHQPDLASLGATHHLGTDPGLAPLYDLALLSGMYGMFAGVLHALALVRTAQVAATDFTSSLLVPWLQAMMATLPEMAHQVDTREYTSEEANLAMQTSGAGIVEFSRAQGVDPVLLAPLFQLMEQRVADGHGTDDVAGVIELIKPPAAIG